MTTSEPPPGQQPEGQPYYAEPPFAGAPAPYTGEPAPYTGEPPAYPAAPQAYPSAPPAPQGYPPPYPYGYPYPPPQQTNGMAIASMVLGILWIYWIGSILALIFGYLARKDIREKGQSGDGMAIAGIVLGWVGIGVLSIVLIAVGVNIAND